MAGAVRARDEPCCWITSCQVLEACQLTVCLGEGGQLTSQREDKDQTASSKSREESLEVFHVKINGCHNEGLQSELFSGEKSPQDNFYAVISQSSLTFIN